MATLCEMSAPLECQGTLKGRHSSLQVGGFEKYGLEDFLRNMGQVVLAALAFLSESSLNNS